jgi:hypothetical protein
MQEREKKGYGGFVELGGLIPCFVFILFGKIN